MFLTSETMDGVTRDSYARTRSEDRKRNIYNYLLDVRYKPIYKPNYFSL